jgi:uncharacterized protein (TIGR00255 family)
MTGYAARSFEFEDYSVFMEIRSVNNKFLDIKFKLPFYFENAEDRLRKLVKGYVKRGKIDVFMKIAAKEQMELRIMKELFNKYSRLVHIIEDESGHRLQTSLSDLLSLRYFLNSAEEMNRIAIPEETLDDCFTQIIEEFMESRRTEGEMTKKELLYHVAEINGIVKRIEDAYPSIIDRYRNQLKERICELIDSQVDETRLMMEVGIFANKVDISEEISRIKSHMKKMEEIIEVEAACGRKLDFVAQELNREVNTVGAKAPDYSVSESSVQIKTALEKIKEQVRNIE